MQITGFVNACKGDSEFYIYIAFQSPLRYAKAFYKKPLIHPFARTFTHQWTSCVEEVRWCVNEPPQHRRHQFKTVFDLWHLKMLWNCSHSQAQLMMGTHLIFHRASTCAELFSTHSTRQPSPSGTSSEDYYSELAANPQRVWLLTILGCVRTEWTVLREKREKEEAKVKNGTFHVSGGHLAISIWE